MKLVPGKRIGLPITLKLTISQRQYQEIEKLAQQHNKGVEELILDSISFYKKQNYLKARLRFQRLQLA